MPQRKGKTSAQLASRKQNAKLAKLDLRTKRAGFDVAAEESGFGPAVLEDLAIRASKGTLSIKDLIKVLKGEMVGPSG